MFPVKRVAIFGNAGGGKSTLARELSEITGLPLHVIDKMQYGPGGVEIPNEDFLRRHLELIETEAWIIDGFGSWPTTLTRVAAADTLIHVDLPIAVHAFWVTKRLVKGLFKTPEGWPKGSPIFKSSLSSYRVLMPCHRHLTPKYRTIVKEEAPRKHVVSLKSKREIAGFLSSIRSEQIRL